MPTVAHLTTLLLASLISLLLLSRPAGAQDVREMSLMSLSTRRFFQAAETQGRTDFPDVREQKGTVVCITFDFRNADVTLATGRDYPNAKMRALGPKLTAALGRPQTDFITFPTTRLTALDMEMNDYLLQPSRNETTFTLDLYHLRQLLEASDLPKPIAFAVDTKEATEAVLAGETSSRPLPVSGIQFLSASEITPGTTLRLSSRVGPVAYIGAAFLLGMFAFPIVMPWQFARMKRKKREKQATSPTAETPTDPAEVQKAYNRQPPMWLILAGMPVVMMFIFLSGGMTQAMRGLRALLPDEAFTYSSFGMLALMGLSIAACHLMEKARDRREGVAPELPDTDKPPTWTVIGWMFPLMGMFLLMPILILFPGALSLPLMMRRIVFYGLLVLIFGGMLLIGWLGHQRTHRKLMPGDRWYDEVMEMAKAAGVRVKNVVVVTSPAVNAYASLYGTVGLTSALLRKMEPEEVRVVVAHEIGHHRDGHPRRQFVISLGVTVVFLALWFGTRAYLEKTFTLSTEAKVLLNSPMFVIFVLPILRSLLMGKDQRRHEEMADRFAVEMAGDPEIVIHTLTKLHTINASPHELKRSDEIIASHPSLKNRIEAIRRAYPISARAEATEGAGNMPYVESSEA